MTDIVLSGYLSQAESSIVAHGTYGMEKLRDIEGITSDVMDALPDLELEFVESQLRFSRYFHDSLLTTDSDTGEVRYATGYQILTPLTGI